MCLLTKQEKPIILKKDLTVKKLVFCKISGDKLKPYGIITDHFYQKQEKSLINLDKLFYNENIGYYGYVGYKNVVDVALHCYPYSVNNYPFSYHIIFKCIIPKGSKVFTDTGNIDDCEEIATDNLIFIKPISYNEMSVFFNKNPFFLKKVKNKLSMKLFKFEKK